MSGVKGSIPGVVKAKIYVLYYEPSLRKQNPGHTILETTDYGHPMKA